MISTPFQYDRPVFIRIPFFARGKNWTHGQHFPWCEMNMPQDKIHILYNHGHLVHDANQETALVVGDGLEAVDLDGLKQIVDDYNKRVKEVVKTELDYKRRKCPSSTVADRQRGLLRSWRRNNLDWLNKAEANK